MTGKKELQRVNKGALAPLAPWSPFRDIELEMRKLMSSVMEDVFTGNGHELSLLSGRPWVPAVNVEETGKEYIFSFEMPGFEKGDFHVDVKNGSLAVSGEKKGDKEEKHKNIVRREQYCGAFRRMFSLPVDAQSEHVKAAYKNGVLRVTVPRSEQAKPKSIHIDVE